MKLTQKLATAGAVAAMGLGLGAASASAYAISGGEYTGTATAPHTFTVGNGNYTISCDIATFTGDATGAATTAFTPTYDDCTFFGFPADVVQDGPWSLTATSGPDGTGAYGGTMEIPAGTSTTINVPVAGCSVVVSGYQDFTSGLIARNFASGTGVELSGGVTGVTYTASGCPFASGTDGTYSTNGNVTIPGITVS